MLRCKLQPKVEISCVWHVHRNLRGNFVKIRQSEPVFYSQEISGWRRKSCKQFPPGALQVAKIYCERVTPPLQLAMFFSRHRCETSCKKNCLVLHARKFENRRQIAPKSHTIAVRETWMSTRKIATKLSENRLFELVLTMQASLTKLLYYQPYFFLVTKQLPQDNYKILQSLLKSCYINFWACALQPAAKRVLSSNWSSQSVRAWLN